MQAQMERKITMLETLAPFFISATASQSLWHQAAEKVALPPLTALMTHCPSYSPGHRFLVHLHGYSEKKSSEPKQCQKVNNQREMALSLDGASGDISEVSQR